MAEAMTETSTQMAQVGETSEWMPPPPPTELIFDDGEPLESNRHRIAMTVLIRSLKALWSEKKDYFTGGNMFIYYSVHQLRNQDFRGPDFFVVLNVEGNPARQGWVVWKEEGRYPDVIVELLSPRTEKVDKGEKKTLYEQVFKTKDYFIYDPFEPQSLQGWRLINWEYQPLVANEQGWLWSETLGLWLGTWQGMVEDDTTTWLRFYTPEGNLVLLPEEVERERAEAERRQGREEGRLEILTTTVPLLLQTGMTLEQIAQQLQLDVALLQQFIPSAP